MERHSRPLKRMFLIQSWLRRRWEEGCGKTWKACGGEWNSLSKAGVEAGFQWARRRGAMTGANKKTHGRSE